MTVEEIFTRMASHMLDGVMIHEQLVHYHNFIHLPGYANFHMERCMEESVNYMRLCKFYMIHYNKLISNIRVRPTEIIPKSWYSYTNADIDSSTLRSSVKSGLEIWIKWEKDTQKLYQELYAELIDIGEIVSARFVEDCVCEVTNELKEAETYYFNKKVRDYDIQDIMDEQKNFSKEKRKEICKVIKESF